ncbi:hypothetical protein EMPG_16588 [Blastomyces silverae]|uniref:Uncharacterized protein n=1 Tax=Blastomyces silverae TaxID=2060906 RepID=A0A0H1BFI7_9EURO|nr:hypothetical protein EMPG_16588 [Blastomyces silverae]
MSTTPNHPHHSNEGGAMSTTTRTMITATTESSSSSATDSPNININNSFTDSAIDLDCSSSENITQTPDTTTTTTMAKMSKAMLMNATTLPPQKPTITITIMTERLMRLARLMADSDSNSNSNSNSDNSNSNSNDSDNDNDSNDKKSNNQTHPHTPSSRSMSLQKLIAINRYLDGIEGLLLDPHDDADHDEVGVHGGKEEREGDEESEAEIIIIAGSPASTISACMGDEHGKSSNAVLAVAVSTSHNPRPPQAVSRSEPEPKIESQNATARSQGLVDHHELDAIMRDLQHVTRCLEQRRVECLHLNAVFTVKCEKLAQRILEMEDEIDELRAEKIENKIELESLKGTMRGLEGWMQRWKKQLHRRNAVDVDIDSGSEYTWSSEYYSSPSSLGGGRGGGEWDHRNQTRKLEGTMGGDGNDDTDRLMDGISAWLHGWNEVEEGFRIRARLRERRVAVRLNRGGD